MADITGTFSAGPGSGRILIKTGGAKPLTGRDRRDIGSTARKILGGPATVDTGCAVAQGQDS